MLRNRRSFPVLECLEDRWAPAISIATPPNACNPGGLDLVITSVPGLTTTTLSVEGIGGDQFFIFENNLGFVGPFTVTDNVLIDLTTFPGSISPFGITGDFTLFNGEDLEGDLTVRLAN